MASMDRVGRAIGYTIAYSVFAAKLVAATAILPGTQVWFMLLSERMGWWPDRVFWFDWLMSFILPGYAIWQTGWHSLFG